VPEFLGRLHIPNPYAQKSLRRAVRANLILKFPTPHFMCARISFDVLEKIAVGLALATNLVFALILLVALGMANEARSPAQRFDNPTRLSSPRRVVRAKPPIVSSSPRRPFVPEPRLWTGPDLPLQLD